MTTLCAFTTVCNSTEDVCTTAKLALSTNTTCENALDNEDTSVICFGTCRTLIDAYLGACSGQVCLFYK